MRRLIKQLARPTVALARFVWGFPTSAFIEGDPLDYANAHGLSLIRWGDGESNILHGMPIHFQRYDPRLAEGLRRVIVNPSRDIVIGIPQTPLTTNILRHLSQRIWLRTRLIWAWHGSSHTRFTDALALRSNPVQALEKLRNILSRKAWCIIVCADQSEADLVNCEGLNVMHIQIKAQNCFDDYDKIHNQIRNAISILNRKHLRSDGLVLIAAGPTAKLWALDLAEIVTVYDIGHLLRAVRTTPKIPLWRG